MYYDEDSGVLELRLPWHLLNVSDPSSAQVLNDIEGTPDIESTESDEFAIYAYFVAKDGSSVVVNSEEGQLTYEMKSGRSLSTSSGKRKHTACSRNFSPI